MKIKNILIRNFRCFKELDETNFAPLTTVVGKNDVGKSTVLLALDYFFNNRVPQKTDFFKEAVTDPILIQIEFDDLSEDLKSKVPEYITETGSLIIQKVLALGSKSRELFLKLDYTNPDFRALENKGQDELKSLVEGLKVQVSKTGIRATNEDMRRSIKSHLDSCAEPRQFSAVEPSAEARKFIEPDFPSYYLYPADSNLTTGQASFQNYFAPIVKLIIDSEKETFDSIETKIKTKLDEAIGTLTTIVKQHNDSVKDLRVTPKFQWESGIRHGLEIIDVFDYPQIFEQRGFGLRRTIMLAVFRLLQKLIVDVHDQETQKLSRAT